MEKKKFRVSGVDEDGDLMAHEADSEERARYVFAQMKEDLKTSRRRCELGQQCTPLSMIRDPL
jgi:hypothetical protein